MPHGNECCLTGKGTGSVGNPNEHELSSQFSIISYLEWLKSTVECFCLTGFCHLPPELGIEPERHGDDAEDSHRRSSCDLTSDGPDSSALRGFASGAVYLASSGLMSACEFGSKLGSRDMNEREAFGWAVRSLRLYDWNPAVPDKPRFQVNGDSLTFREICERAKKLDEPLPEVIKYDLYPLLGRAPDLQAKLRLNETYSVAATCLLEFLTGRERN